MHAMFYGVKRVHLRVMHLSRALLNGTFLTPARFDMMRIVWLYDESGGVQQAKLQELLGVSAPTISRMLKALEELGFVVRERMARDRRRVVVTLSGSGFGIIGDALRIVDREIPERFALRGFGFARDAARESLQKMRGLLSRIRRNYGDPALVEDPWEVHIVPYAYTHLVDGRITYGVPADDVLNET